MKDVYSYPRTLRNYDDDKNLNSKKITFIDKSNLDKKNVYLSTYNPRQNILQQDHILNEDQTLTNNSQIVTKKAKKSKAKSKSKSKQSHFSNALKHSLSNKAITFQQIGPQNILHCKSLQKLQIISNDRSEEIKTLINQKAQLIAENQELKMKLVNPTYRQQQFVQKIVKQELQIENLKETLKRKEQRIIEIQSQHKMQIQRLKNNFQQQLANLRGGMSQTIQHIPEKRRDSQKVYYTHTTSNQINPIRQVVQAASYQIEPTSVNSIGSGVYKISHSNDYKSSLNPVVINSTNMKSYSPKKEVAVNDTKQQFQTYVGQDGYERRVYYRNTGNQKLDNYRGEPQRIKIFAHQENQSQNKNQSSSYGTFTNAKISSYVSKQPQRISSVNKYSSSQQSQQSSQQNDTKLHNQNLYSQSLTFQCFNDQN